MKKQKHTSPSRSQFSVLRQICNVIPPHLVPKLARETSVDAKARTYSPWSHLVSLLYAQHTHAMREGTLIDASIIAAPCSTKNRRRERDPHMHQTKKGNQWYFGMKAHIGADETSGLVHSVEGTAANVSDISQAHALLHGEEKRAGVDAGYTGVEKRPEIVALGGGIEWRVAARRSTIKAQPEGWAKAISGAWEKLKARTRALVEHPFHIVKNIFGHRKVRYRGLAKNTAQLRVLFALANLYMVRRQLLSAAAA